MQTFSRGPQASRKLINNFSFFFFLIGPSNWPKVMWNNSSFEMERRRQGQDFSNLIGFTSNANQRWISHRLGYSSYLAVLYFQCIGKFFTSGPLLVDLCAVCGLFFTLRNQDLPYVFIPPNLPLRFPYQSSYYLVLAKEKIIFYYLVYGSHY